MRGKVLLTAAVLCASASPASAAVTWGSVTHLYTPDGPQRYSYAPAAVTENGETYVYTCHNDSSGQILDHVYLSRAGGASRSVVAPTAGGWDSTHVCDPAVIAANVRYGQTDYRYVMFFLGTDHANSNNQIGVAFAQRLDGPWVKHPRPIVTTPFEPGHWGAGQPSATTINPATGELMLFYSQGGPATESYFRYLRIADMANPVVGEPVRITDEGLGGDVLHNFDIAYDPGRDRFYAAREAAPYPAGEPSYISERVELVSIDGASIWGGTGRWVSEGFVTPSLTGHPRNHNPGILKTVHGTLPDFRSVTTVVSVARTGSFPNSLWSYHLRQVTGTLR